MNRSIFFHEEYDPELSSKADHDTLRIFGLLCAICFDIPRDVVKTKHSNNLYCRNCLSQCNKDPVTRKELQIGVFKELAKINCSDFPLGSPTGRGSDNLFFQYPHHQKGCVWENPLSAVNNHVKNDCNYFVTDCKFCDDAVGLI